MAGVDIFDAMPPATPEGNVDLSLNDLVGEGRKYKTPDELAKAYAHIEAHARRLEAENAEARAKFDRASFANNDTANPNPDGNNPPNADQPSGTPPQNAPDSGNQNVDFRSQIREEVRALNEQERMVQNMEQAAAKMTEVYGSPQKANEAIQTKARELGVGVEWLRDAAARSPSAFFATMGIGNAPGPRATPASGEGVRMPSGDDTAKNFEYYERMRKDNPKLYFSAATQGEMMNQARTLGSAFYQR